MKETAESNEMDASKEGTFFFQFQIKFLWIPSHHRSHHLHRFDCVQVVTAEWVTRLNFQLGTRNCYKKILKFNFRLKNNYILKKKRDSILFSIEAAMVWVSLSWVHWRSVEQSRPSSGKHHMPPTSFKKWKMKTQLGSCKCARSSCKAWVSKSFKFTTWTSSVE